MHYNPLLSTYNETFESALRKTGKLNEDFLLASQDARANYNSRLTQALPEMRRRRMKREKERNDAMKREKEKKRKQDARAAYVEANTTWNFDDFDAHCRNTLSEEKYAKISISKVFKIIYHVD